MVASSGQSRRRPHGQGTILERSPGVWRLRAYVGRDVITGRPIQRSRELRGTRAGAEKALQRFRAELENSPAPKQNPGSRLVLSDVIEAHLAASTWSPGTRRSYESAFRRHINAGLGQERVDAVTAAKMRGFYKALADVRGLGPSSIWSIYSLISGALRRATRELGVRFDFNQLVTPPKPVVEKRAYATDDELARLFVAADELGAEWPLLIRLACAGGMRRGELVALRWSSLDSNGRLHVARAIADGKGSLLEKLPKNGHDRYVQLDDETIRRWNATKGEAIERRHAAGLELRESDYVFSSAPDGLTPRRPDRVSDVWSELRSAAAVNHALEFRALRNWHVTILDDELGFELAKIGRRVGHSWGSSTATGMTARYSLSDKKVDAEMAAGVAAKLVEIDDLAVTLRSPLGVRGDSAGRAPARRKVPTASPEISPK